MPADAVPDNAIPKLAEQIDSPIMLGVLGYLQQATFLFHSAVDGETAYILRRLAKLGLVDAGYDGPTSDKPFIWVRNGNGGRVLQYFEEAFKPELKIHPSVEPALGTLSERDRQAVLGMVRFLRRKPPASWPADLAIPLDAAKPMYLLRVTPDLRAFVTILDSGGLELSGIVREETLRLMREQQRDEVAHP